MGEPLVVNVQIVILHFSAKSYKHILETFLWNRMNNYLTY